MLPAVSRIKDWRAVLADWFFTSVLCEVLWCLFVRPHPYLGNHAAKFGQFLCMLSIWPWLGPPLATMRYVNVLPVLWLTSCWHMYTYTEISRNWATQKLPRTRNGRSSPDDSTNGVSTVSLCFTDDVLLISHIKHLFWLRAVCCHI